MRPAVVITIAVLLLAILGAAVLQFFILDPDVGIDDGQSAPPAWSAPSPEWVAEPGAVAPFVHL